MTDTTPNTITAGIAPASPNSPVGRAAAARAAEDAARDAALAAQGPPPPLVPDESFEIDELPSPDDDHLPMPPSLPPIPEPGEPATEDEMPVESEPESPAPAEDERPDLAGKRIVLFFDIEHATRGWAIVDGMYEGTRDDAIKAALDDQRGERLADEIRSKPERFLLVSVPASSWAPAPVKPRVTKTTWVVQR